LNTNDFDKLVDVVDNQGLTTGGRVGAAPAAPPSPSLSISNICNGGGKAAINELTGGHKRTAQAIYLEIEGLAERYGLEKLLFITFTFADQVRDMKEAQRRMHSLETGVLRQRYGAGVGVVERQKSGRVHFHWIFVGNADYRTGVDFKAFENKDYKSAPAALKEEWRFWTNPRGRKGGGWRGTAERYQFGRTEVLPVISSDPEAIARYLGKYISKNVGQRLPEDKGARMVRYMNFKPGDRRANSQIGFIGEKARLWRAKVGAWAEANGCKSYEELRQRFGVRWAWKHCEDIMCTWVKEFVFGSRMAAEAELDRYSRALSERYFRALDRFERAVEASEQVGRANQRRMAREAFAELSAPF
jgi:hypothetical protein